MYAISRKSSEANSLQLYIGIVLVLVVVISGVFSYFQVRRYCSYIG